MLPSQLKEGQSTPTLARGSTWYSMTREYAQLKLYIGAVTDEEWNADIGCTSFDYTDNTTEADRFWAQLCAHDDLSTLTPTAVPPMTLDQAQALLDSLRK